jgi:hypothetical protein
MKSLLVPFKFKHSLAYNTCSLFRRNYSTKLHVIPSFFNRERESKYLKDNFFEASHPTILLGDLHTGKTNLIRKIFNDDEKVKPVNIDLRSSGFSDWEGLQKVELHNEFSSTAKQIIEFTKPLLPKTVTYEGVSQEWNKGIARTMKNPSLNDFGKIKNMLRDAKFSKWSGQVFVSFFILAPLFIPLFRFQR